MAALLLAEAMLRGLAPARGIRRVKAMAVVRARATRTIAEAVDVVGVVVDVAGVVALRVGPGDREGRMVGRRMREFPVNRGSPVDTRRRTGATMPETGATVGRDRNRQDCVMRAELRNGRNDLRHGIGNPTGLRIGARMHHRRLPEKPDLTVSFC